MPADDPSDRPSGIDRGMIPREDLPFRPQIRWWIWAPLGAVIVALVAGLLYNDRVRASRLRSQLLAEHAVVTGLLAPPYRSTRDKVERLAFAAVAPWQGTYVAPGFTFASLGTEPVLYGRIRMPEIHRREDVAASIRHRYPDQLVSCLGIEADRVHLFYSKGEFLMPAYVDSVRAEGNGSRIDALRKDLEFRLQRDTHDLDRWSRRRYLALAVDEGAASVSGPTRLYVFDLRNEQPVLRVRSTGDETVIIPIRIAGMPGGGRPVPQPSRRMDLSQHDCAVANEARQQLGVSVMTLQNAPTPPREPPSPADAGISDGSTARD